MGEALVLASLDHEGGQSNGEFGRRAVIDSCLFNVKLPGTNGLGGADGPIHSARLGDRVLIEANSSASSSGSRSHAGVLWSSLAYKKETPRASKAVVHSNIDGSQINGTQLLASFRRSLTKTTSRLGPASRGLKFRK